MTRIIKKMSLYISMDLTIPQICIQPGSKIKEKNKMLPTLQNGWQKWLPCASILRNKVSRNTATNEINPSYKEYTMTGERKKGR